MPFSFANREQRANTEPASLIIDFLKQLRSLLNNIALGEVEGFDFKPDLGDDRELVLDALREAEELRFFERTMEGISDANLQDTGLTRKSLSAKLGILESLSRELRKGIKKALKYILDMVNAIVGSIKTALGPVGAVADAIAEIKDMIKAKIEIANDW